MRADLHIHSLFSDGRYAPATLARFLKGEGVALFSLTDHDSMAGTDEAASAARELGLHFVRGWEVSAYEGACKVHILGYGCKKDEHYERFVKDRFKGALVRISEMVRRANASLGLNVTMDEVERYHERKNAPLHTMHVVSAFASRLSRGKGEVYRDYFAFGGPAFCEDCRPTPADAIEIIHKTGGIAVLAHPGRILDLNEEEIRLFRESQGSEVRQNLQKISDGRRDRLMERLVALGIDGIECNYTTHTAMETEYFTAFARKHGLFVTGGSDFHMEGGRAVLGLPAFEADPALVDLLLSFDGSV